jgi:transposase
MKAMAKHRTHSIEFKRQVAQDFIAGETLHALASRHDVSRNLIRIWVRKFEAGAFDDEAQSADLIFPTGGAEFPDQIGGVPWLQAAQSGALDAAVDLAPRIAGNPTQMIGTPLVLSTAIMSSMRLA